MTVSWRAPQMMFFTLDAHLLPALPNLVRGPTTWKQVNCYACPYNSPTEQPLLHFFTLFSRLTPPPYHCQCPEWCIHLTSLFSQPQSLVFTLVMHLPLHISLSSTHHFPYGSVPQCGLGPWDYSLNIAKRLLLIYRLSRRTNVRSDSYGFMKSISNTLVHITKHLTM